MKCNYKNTVKAYERIQHYQDKQHFNENGTSFVVGDIYPDFIGSPDMCSLHTRFGGLILISALKHPSVLEIYNFYQGNIKFALCEEDDILFLLSKFGGDNWCSSCLNYSIDPSAYLVSSEEQVLTCLLIDTSSGKLLGIRTVNLQSSFVKTLTDAIKKQASKPCSVELFSQKSNAIYHKYPTDNDLLKTAFCQYDCNI